MLRGSIKGPSRIHQGSTKDPPRIHEGLGTGTIEEVNGGRAIKTQLGRDLRRD